MAAALLLALATLIGAIGAHALRSRLPADRLEVLQTAVYYQFFHALGLFGLGLALQRAPARALSVAAWLVLCGVVLFSGSLYLLLAGAPRLIGALTPVGGVCLILGWCAAAWALRPVRAA
jgi:uncharacterized membrane protein YgdD (TMEM256/DUF423 family)